MLTGWKNDPDTAWLYEASDVALPHATLQYRHRPLLAHST